ncbi:MAG: menaquinone biosynthesis protein [Candidatus Krumholzibacteriota bacterium]|nr:menaquinone biosynthesis protein [Candidatus Krumholzibacteriota bacterium]
MTLRVGKIPYLNSVLFYYLLERDKGATPITFEPLVPRALSSAARENAIDCGPVPLVACWDLEDSYEPLVADERGDFCISTLEKARSILLFSKKPFESLGRASIGVTNETSTSVRLLKVLLDHYWGVGPPRYTHLDWPNNDAFLLIGDEALIHRNGVKGYPHTADLGEVWHRWTGLPFVFARWVVRNDLAPGLRRELVERIDASIEAGWKEFDEVVDGKAHELSMTMAEMREYLEGFRFRMTNDEYEAITRFHQLDGATQAGSAAAANQ